MFLGRRKWLVIGGAILAACARSQAADGRIPIYQPVTITASGSYVLTRDVQLPPGDFITVVGTIAVTIDLAGHTVTGGPGSNLISVQRDASTQNCGAVRVRDGRVEGAQPIFTVFYAFCVWDVEFDRMSFESTTLETDNNPLVVTSSSFHNASIQVSGDRSPGVSRIEDNVVHGGSIIVDGQLGAQIRRNTISGGAIIAFNSDGRDNIRYIIDGNSADSISVGDAPFATSPGLVVTGNTVDSGMVIGGAIGGRVANNVVEGCSRYGGGISLLSSHDNLIEGNNVTACPYGLTFDESSFGNTYRSNVLRRASASAVHDDGNDNLDAGGNVR